jgi:PPOX class probable F420-dependent enzyme
LSKDNSPHLTPVWADMDEKEELVLINSFEGSAKVRNVRRDPRVALSIVETHNTYKMVSMKGKVVDVTMNDADNHLHKLAKKYLGIGKYYYRKPSHKRVIIYFVFHFQHTWGIIKLCQYATHFGVGQNQAIMSKIKFRKL